MILIADLVEQYKEALNLSNTIDAEFVLLLSGDYTGICRFLYNDWDDNILSAQKLEDCYNNSTEFGTFLMKSFEPSVSVGILMYQAMIRPKLKTRKQKNAFFCEYLASFRKRVENRSYSLLFGEFGKSLLSNVISEVHKNSKGGDFYINVMVLQELKEQLTKRRKDMVLNMLMENHIYTPYSNNTAINLSIMAARSMRQSAESKLNDLIAKNEETKIEEITSLLKNEVKSTIDKNSELENELKKIKEWLNEANRIINIQDKNILSKEKEIDKLKEELSYYKLADEIEEPEDSDAIKLDCISDRVIVIGGSVKWQTKLINKSREDNIDIKIIKRDSLNFEFKHELYDKVYFNVIGSSHSVYFRLLSMCPKEKIVLIRTNKSII